MEWNEDKNPYEVLQLETGVDSSEDEIKKAYRKLALTKHPDRNPNNPNANNEFIELQKAYAILTDEQAREAWRALERAKQARQAKRAGHTEKRRRMMDELQRREQVVAAERSQEERARADLKRELERLKRQHAERQAARHAGLVAESAAHAHAGASRQAQGQFSTEELMRTLKVTWQRSEGEYTVEELQQAFSQHGPVVDVVLLQSKKKAKGSALVQMGTLPSAAAAAQAVNGDLAKPLLVVPFSRAPETLAVHRQGSSSPTPHPSAPSSPSPAGEPAAASTPASPPLFSSFPAASTPAQPNGAHNAFSSFPASFPAGVQSGPGRPQAASGTRSAASNSFGGGAPPFSSFPGAGAGTGQNGGRAAPLFGAGNKDFESVTLMRMRQKAERERLIAELNSSD